MLSGIGPKDELAKHDIPSLHSLPGVGENLQDHPFSFLTVRTTDGSNGRAIFGKPEAYAAARKELIEKSTGALGKVYGTVIMAFNKASEELLASEEYENLPEETKRYIHRPTVPTSEYIAHGLPAPPFVDQTKTYISFLVAVYSPQSRGTIKLASSDPKDAPLCDPNILTHPFDRKSYVDSMRRLYRLVKSSAFDTAGTYLEWVLAPKSDSDEDIWAFTSQVIGTTWHMSSTVKMGKANDEMACVDTDFKVRGLDGLRVADMSVVPFVFNCHVQSVAYGVGEACAERLINEYGLDA